MRIFLLLCALALPGVGQTLSGAGTFAGEASPPKVAAGAWSFNFTGAQYGPKHIPKHAQSGTLFYSYDLSKKWQFHMTGTDFMWCVACSFTGNFVAYDDTLMEGPCKVITGTLHGHFEGTDLNGLQTSWPEATGYFNGALACSLVFSNNWTATFTTGPSLVIVPSLQ